MPSRTWTTSVAVALVALTSGCVTLGDLPDYGPGPSESAAPVPTPSADPTPTVAPVVDPTDSGPADFASGEAQEVAEGQFSYVVASGDTPAAIASRFGVCTLDVLESNPPQDPWLIVGQTINIQRVTEIPLGTHDCQFDVDTL